MKEIISNKHLNFAEMHLKLREAIDCFIKKDNRKEAKLEGYFKSMYDVCGIRPPNWHL